MNVNNVQTTLTANFAAEQFSATQGKNQWRYRYEIGEAMWADMPRYSASDNNGAWEASEGQYFSAFNMAPARCTEVALPEELRGSGWHRTREPSASGDAC